jgi:hypothetical protein
VVDKDNVAHRSMAEVRRFSTGFAGQGIMTPVRRIGSFLPQR